MASTHEALPIKLRDLESFRDRANILLLKAVWTPKEKRATNPVSPATGGAFVYRGPIDGSPQSQEIISLYDTAKNQFSDSILWSDHTNRVLQAVRLGIQIGLYLSSLYEKASNLDHLIAQNKSGVLPDAHRAEFREKNQTSSAIALFGLAYYALWDTENHKSSSPPGTLIELPDAPEVSLEFPGTALECAIFYYASFIAKSGQVATEKELLQFTALYFKKIIDELKLREQSLKYTEAFIDRSYKLEESEFTVNGFNADLSGSHANVEFNRVELHQVVGNRDVKHHARRLAQRIVAYDFECKRNIMYDLGGLTKIFLCHGEPGTGKTMMASATATMISDLCKWRGVPFRYNPMPQNLVDTFQGASATKALNWLNAAVDPSYIVFSAADDAENNFEDRTRQGVSEGVKGIIGVFLRWSEGASASNEGNSVLGFYTNIPGIIDPAVLSRMWTKVYIGGAQDWKDFVDQDYLWWKRYREMDPNFINMRDPAGYPYLQNQKLLGTLSEVMESYSKPKEERIRPLFEKVESEHGPNEHIFLGKFYEAMKKEFKNFTSRDVRNIQRAVDSRVMDFDFPPDWMENPEIFYRKPYDIKKSMVHELMTANMKGLSFAELHAQEAIVYCDNFVRVVDSERERRISQEIESFEMQQEVRDRLKRKYNPS